MNVDAHAMQTAFVEGATTSIIRGEGERANGQWFQVIATPNACEPSAIRPPGERLS